MSSYSIQDATTDLEGILHGTTTNQITGLNQLYNRAARQLLLDIDPQETKRTLQFVSPIFNTVTDYAIADDVKGNRLIDIRPQVNRTPRDIWSQAYNQAFDIAKQNVFYLADMFTMNFNTGIKTVRINAPFLPPPIVLNYADSLNDNGTWSTLNGANNLQIDNVNYVQGGASLEFDLDASGTGSLTNSTSNALNLSSDVNQGSFFFYVYLPTGADFTSVTFSVGSSPSDYYTGSTNVTQQNTSFQNGWNLLQISWLSMSPVGSPDMTNTTFIQVDFTYTGAQTAARLNDIFFSLGSILEYEYYSKFLFRDAITGAFQEKVTDSSNLINLDTETYNLFFNLSASLAVQQQQGLDALFYDGNFFAQKYAEGVARYKALYKSEAQKPQTTYYRQPNVSNRRWIGSRWSY